MSGALPRSPWTWNDNGQLVDGAGDDILTGWDDESVIVARMADRDDTRDDAIRSLIAAAPDLLAACELFASLRGHKSTAVLNAAFDDAVAAIAKARGGA